MSDLLEGLNESQREAVQYMDGPLLVLAGPGSGKTRVVTHRIAWLLEQGIYDRRIAALTFTNKAAEEMKSRLANLSPGNRVWIGTFHRFCASLLRGYATCAGLSSNFTIYDADQSKRLLDSLIERKELPTGVDSAKIAAAISWAKNGLVSSEEYVARPGHLLGEEVVKVYPRYQKALQEANAVDFDDLLVHVAQLLRNNPEMRKNLDERFRYILVDEYQDTNLVQYAIVRALSIDHPNLGVTGDPDQSIYGWRGANIRNILDFEKDFKDVKVIRLEQNYRSTKRILAIASQLIKKNKLRKEKELYTDNDEGVLPRIATCEDHKSEAECIAREIAAEIAAGRYRGRDYAIFYRTNALSRNLEHALHRLGVPFQLVRGLEFFNRKEIKDIIAYLQLIYNPNDTIAFKRIINMPLRGIGHTTVERLEEFANLNSISLLEATGHVQKIPKITPKTKKAIENFSKLIHRLSELSVDADLEVLLSVMLRETGYMSMLAGAETEEDKERLANVQELLSEVKEFDRVYNEEEKGDEENLATLFERPSRLGRFLEQSALTSDVDAWDENSDRVSLMTLHAAKGLEFPVVYIVAMEENILPHERSCREPAQLEEERRLLFVGMTRAQKELRMSKTLFREFRGSYNASIASRFLFDISPDSMTRINSADDIVPPAVNEPQEESSQMFLSDLLNGSTETDPETGDEIVYFQDSPKASRRKQTKRATKKTPPIHQAEPGEIVFEADNPVQFSDQDTEPVCQLDEPEIVFDEEGEYSPKPVRRKPNRKPRFISPSAITTATELASQMGDDTDVEPYSDGKRASTPPLSAAKLNCLVRHKDFGIGKIVAFQGPKDDRIATVEFLSSVGTVDVSLNDPRLSLLALNGK